MNLVLKRIAIFTALLLTGVLARASGTSTSGTTTTTGTNDPIFLTGTSNNGPYPFYQANFNSVPVGKTLVIPISLSGSGPMTYTATSSSAALSPIIKTGYPVMNIHVTYSGTAAQSGTMGSFTTLHAFTGGTDGGMPYAGLTTGTDGNLYGTTEADGSSGFGTVFKSGTGSAFTTIYSFSGGADGGNPYGTLLTGTDGNFYGTTGTGGTAGYGTVFKVTASGSLSTLYAFTDGTDGGNPYAGLVSGTDGNFYGTTKNGGNGGGTIFKITPGGSLTTLYAFSSGSGADGAAPTAPLVLSGTNFYGTTTAGGAGYGTVFQVGSSGSFSTIHTFSGGQDGSTPYAGLIAAAGGELYGTTETSGTGGHGTIFQMTTSGSLATLYSFQGGMDGGNPFGSLFLGANGYLYGTTTTNGSSGYGTLYDLAQGSGARTLNVIHAFTGGPDGGNPYSGLLSAGGGYFYGTTMSGSSGYGTVYQAYIPTTGTDAFSGTMSFALLRDMAPTTTGYIAGFAQAGYYNGTEFFRITNLGSSGQNEEIAQGGDPTNTGTGSPGFAYDNELKPSLIFSGQGQLAMANAGNDPSTYKGTNGSQFFITSAPIRSLDFGYTIFGQLLTGFDVMQKVMGVPKGSDGSTPTAKVVMDSVTVTEDNNDAILLVTGAGYVPNGATVTVNAMDPAKNKAQTINLTGTAPSYSAGLPITMATPNVDAINDPPIVEPVAPINAALHKSVNVPFRTQDLEFDYMSPSATELASTGVSSILPLRGNVATVVPSSSSPLGSVLVGLNASQPYAGPQESTASGETSVQVGLGTGTLTPIPEEFASLPNEPLGSSTSTFASPAGVYGSFTSSNPQESGSNFTATINWGDGSTLSGTNSATVVHAPPIPTRYNISDPTPHIYSHPGIYPVTVTVSDTNGATVSINSTAVVSSSNIYAYGRTFTAPNGVANAVVATFVDHAPNVNASDYGATINWGDGSVTTGSGTSIIRGGGGNFSVFGKHKYTAGTTYPVDVTIFPTNGATSTAGYAWSVATLSGVSTRQPPFAQSHIIGEVDTPGFNGLDLDEEVTLVNSGNIASGPITLRFFLSPTSATDPIDPKAIQLAVGKGSTYNTPSIPAGSSIQGAVSNIVLPSNVNSQGDYIIMQVITADPIGSHMNYPRAFSDPFPLLE